MGIPVFQFLYWGRFIITFPTYEANNSDGCVIYCTCGPFLTRVIYRFLNQVLGFR